MRLVLISAAAALLLSACGGNSRPANPGSFTGTVNGVTLTVKDSILTASGASGAYSSLTVLISDQPNSCSKVGTTSNALPTNATGVVLEMAKVDPNGTAQPLGKGTYTIVAAASAQAAATAAAQQAQTSGTTVPFVFAFFNKVDATGNPLLTPAQSAAASGTVTLSKFDPTSEVDGTFSITFGQSDKVTGQFAAAPCPQ